MNDDHLLLLDGLVKHVYMVRHTGMVCGIGEDAKIVEAVEFLLQIVYVKVIGIGCFEKSLHDDGFVFGELNQTEEAGKEGRIAGDAVVLSVFIDMEAAFAEEIEVVIQVSS